MAVDQEELRHELRTAYEMYYMAGFRTNNVALIDEVVRYPLTYISNGRTRTCKSFPLDPAELKRQKQWDHSKDWAFDILSIGDDGAHVAASAIRCREDGSEIEAVHGFYVFGKISGRWRMICLAEMTMAPRPQRV